MFRLVLSVSMVAQSVAVEVNAEDVEPVRTPVQAGQLSSGRQVDVLSPLLPVPAHGAQWGADAARPDIAAKVG